MREKQLRHGLWIDSKVSMEMFESDSTHQVFVKLLDGKHKILNFTTPSISVSTLKDRIQTLTSIPSHLQLLLFNDSLIIHDNQTLNISQSRKNFSLSETLDPSSSSTQFPVVVHLLLRLRGGKGGFGSLLRGAATKAGQKKTNNFDACRDMNGRRLRHVNAEKKLEEWRAEAGERKLEKMAEEYIKKKEKELVKSGKSKGGDSASERYVAKYREESAKCMEEVERSVRESLKGLASSKRKSSVEGSESGSKRLKIWFGKKKLSDSDSEDSDEGEEEEDKKSVIIDTRSRSDSNEEAEGSSGSVTGGKLDGGSLAQASFGSGSEEDENVCEESSKPGKILDVCGHDDDGRVRRNDNPAIESHEENIDHNGVVIKGPHESHSDKVEEIISQLPDSAICEPVLEEAVSLNVKVPDLDKPLNFDEYHSAAALEVLGMERLKAELQVRGLKCGGTVQERAARLFLLKSTPLEMLPKKLFAKK